MKLIKINLRKANEHNHPDIKVGDKYQYLIKYDKRFYAGSFSRQWYGLNFEGVYDAGLQFDAPGSNCSEWQAVWLIKQ